MSGLVLISDESTDVSRTVGHHVIEESQCDLDFEWRKIWERQDTKKPRIKQLKTANETNCDDPISLFGASWDGRSLIKEVPD